MDINEYGLDIEQLKKEHCNHKCIICKHRFIFAYEDDTPASYTPYHWWLGKCAKLSIDIKDDELPPEDCPFEELGDDEHRYE